ncbi:zinc metalloproteinase nas-13-like [Culicoides brevitarsis]|uniref:zinc metalloproteinase nas-13-like n=1 Tax=Culicoides brevitarsis TaxID=469753 RepID=UPI00307B12DD
MVSGNAPTPRMAAFGQENPVAVDEEIKTWNEDLGDNIWEHSGLEEGDIIRPVGRNGLRSKSARWPLGIIPYRIAEGHFTEAEERKIQQIIDEYNDITCLQFRPMVDSDENFVDIVNSFAGCWSSVGMDGGQQYLNLQTPQCIRYATIRHEMLHVVGFMHQQSSSNRDKFLRINWENIIEGKRHNFAKYPASKVDNYGLDYDYDSIMHYSGVAFSKNGKPTMEPLKGDVTLIRKQTFSEGDLKKLANMYKEECRKRENLTK